MRIAIGGQVSWPPVGWVPQGQTLDDSFAPDVSVFRRLTAMQIALSLVGLRAPDPRYVSALYPWDNPASGAGMALGQHKCALTVLAIVRAMGFETSDDGKPYGNRFATRPLSHVPADAMSAVRMLPSWESRNVVPQPGDAFIIELPGNPSLTHAAMCIGHEDDQLVSVDGHYAREPVDVCRRTVVLSNGQVWLKDKRFIRRVLGTVGTGKLVATREWVLPSCCG